MHNCALIQLSKVIFPGRNLTFRIQRLNAVWVVLKHPEREGDMFISNKDIEKIPHQLKTSLKIITDHTTLNSIALLAAWIFY
jgi:hypothetical protein